MLDRKPRRCRGRQCESGRIRTAGLCNSNSNLRDESIESRLSPRRIESESEPPSLATETGAHNGLFEARGRSLRFGFAKPIARNPAESSGFRGEAFVPAAKSLQPKTDWRWKLSVANSSLRDLYRAPSHSTGTTVAYSRVSTICSSRNRWISTSRTARHSPGPTVRLMSCPTRSFRSQRLFPAWLAAPIRAGGLPR